MEHIYADQQSQGFEDHKRMTGKASGREDRAGKRLQALESRGVYLNRRGKGQQRAESGPQAEDSRTLGNTVSVVLPAAR